MSVYVSLFVMCLCVRWWYLHVSPFHSVLDSARAHAATTLAHAQKLKLSEPHDGSKMITALLHKAAGDACRSNRATSSDTVSLLFHVFFFVSTHVLYLSFSLFLLFLFLFLFLFFFLSQFHSFSLSLVCFSRSPDGVLGSVMMPKSALWFSFYCCVCHVFFRALIEFSHVHTN